jgi:predicted O-methyltransferase YrrM
MALLREISRFYPEFDWPESPKSGRRFYLHNKFFEIADPIILYALLRRFRPKGIIEVGSGFPSALMLDTNDRFFDGTIDLTFIEPYPERLRSLLTDHDKRRIELLETVVQSVHTEAFASLQPNDILFIDSSHVAKIGSDVNYLVFEILPRLKPGVVVHVHDIMWPFEYPKEWLMEGRAWNEAYVVRAFLQFNEAFDIVLFNSYAGHCFRGLLEELMPRFLENTGGSLWLQKR